MKYPCLVLRSVCKTPITVRIFSEEISEDGEPQTALELSTVCNYQDKAHTVITADKTIVQLSGTALFIGAYNYIYCIINEDHHKMCYTFKWFIIAFGVGGYVKNIVSDIKQKKKLSNMVAATTDAVENAAETNTEKTDVISADKNNSGTSSDIPESDDPNN